jgi:hypothetical protein
VNPEGYLRDRSRAAGSNHCPTAGWLVCAAALAVGALVLAGCSQNLYVRGVREPGVGKIGTMTPLYVELEKGTDDPKRDRALAGKIERVLGEKGYTVVPEADAVAHLYFQYEIEDLVGRKYLQPIPGSSSGMKTVPAEGPFVHRLSVSVVHASPDPATENPQGNVLWVGGAVLDATSIRSPEVVDILIVALFEQFPEDTGRTLRVPMRFRDSRAEDLRTEPD